MSWRYIDVGAIDGFTMTNLYEAVAKTVSDNKCPNTFILTQPTEPFVNVGFHQIVEKEVDIDFVKSQNIPIVRRSLGGGTILDGSWELDYFFIVHKNSKECPANIEDFYRQFLSIPIHALKRRGVQAEYKPINDIIVKERKISGNGGISIGDSMVLAGDILLDLPIELMTRVLKVPDEKFRDKYKKSLSEWMTSLKAELGTVPNRDGLKKDLVKAFKEQINKDLTEGQLSAKEKQYLNELLAERKQREWIYMKDMSHQHLFQSAKIRHLKVKEGVNIYEGAYKAQKLIRITMEIVDDHINDISISGDFFTQPYTGVLEKLEHSLVEVPLEKKVLQERIQQSFNKLGLKVTGATVDDFVNAILVIKET
jgi:lipoate-protein ligase A